MIEFNWIDWLVIGLYLTVVVGVSIFFAWQRKKQKSNFAKTYFTGDGKIPGWVLGFSIWSTILSVITYLSTPANAYTYGWIYSFAQLTMLIFAPFLIKKIVPFFRLMKQSSAYSYLEARFSYSIRALNASLFIFFNIFRAAIIIYITALTLSLVIPIDVWQVMLIMGILITITTLFGGIKGIAWSDAIQAIIRIGFVIIMIIFALVGTDFKTNYVPAPTFNKNSFNIDIVNAGIPLILISNIIITASSYVTSQDTVRRYKASSNIKKINLSIWYVAGLSLLSIFLFYGLGSSLYSFYQGAKIKSIDPNIMSTSQIIPYFAYTTLPKGLGALLIASILTASQSNVSSGITAIVNSIITDFVLVKKPNFSVKKLNLITQLAICFFGIISTLLAIGNLLLNIEDLIVYFLGVMSLFGAVPVAVFFLAMFTKRTSSKAVLIASISGFIFSIILWLFSQNLIFKEPIINSLWIAIFGFVFTFLLGYLLSFIFVNKKDITNLCWQTVSSEFKEIIRIENIIFSKRKTKKLSQQQYSGLLKKHKELKKYFE